MASRAFPHEPRAAVGVVVVHDGKVLLVRRSSGPSADLWAVPGGAVELGESLAEAAEREVREETGIEVRAKEVVHAFDAIEREPDGSVRHHYVVVDLVADYVDGAPAAGDDAGEACWVALDDLAGRRVSGETLRLLGRLSRSSLSPRPAQRSARTGRRRPR